ncbi:hypothetical protein F3Y22_tig00111311pilonHSYRG00271 [Hibiscus syriacus]|uniref:Protein NIM1-INTERACTING 1-like n=1 Tax=Hibiscus syriacus TaxID=106335 RepID=A0A6A2YQM2_HIBSY|nr:protein NIM1-INTERACTING 1-like [Hibiscus syriacus]KAE8681668.1 hypothetical protein F3Y22_tig00111311pilonHSYRG00271 [Hibiscus syriacus]
MATEERNRVSDGEDDREDQEDEKMEQFFALLRNFREARNKRKHELKQRDEEEEMSKKMKKNKTIKLGDDERPSWVPRFEWEDFTAEIEFRRQLIVFPTPYEKKQEEDDGLDLNLTLSSAAV